MKHHVDVGHSHEFDTRNPLAERRTRQVMWLTAVMMVVEIVAGTIFGSMALLADGWHMSSHALALGVAAGAYALARRHADDPRFAFGTWKIEVLGGKYFAAGWLDPMMGLVGTVLVGRWALGLLRDTGRVLLDAEMDAPVVREVHEVIESLPHSAEVRDLHVWRVGKGKYACIVSVTTSAPLSADEVRRRLAVHDELVHITVEAVTRTA